MERTGHLHRGLDELTSYGDLSPRLSLWLKLEFTAAHSSCLCPFVSQSPVDIGHPVATLWFHSYLVLEIRLAFCCPPGAAFWIQGFLVYQLLVLFVLVAFLTHFCKSCNSCAPGEVGSLFLPSVTTPFPSLPSHQRNLFLSSKCDL